ncbi:MAG: ATP-grasp domain-containing protein [Bacteriovoracaceae bacterium]|nr:ATP-grasp domain-containing protein [Bacteriovoracaceae bacterium]
MRKKRILLLVHPSLIPPPNVHPQQIELETLPWRTEYYVQNTLEFFGHDVLVLGVSNDLMAIRLAKDEFKPNIAFNLLEEFDGESVFDHSVVSYLELLKLPYTGCNPRGLLLARDKALSKKILHYHHIKTPHFAVAKMGKNFKRSKKLEFPLIVKSLVEEGSAGISQNSIVTNDKKLQERITFIHEHILSDAIVETFIEGRDLYVSLMGNKRVKTFPILELEFKNAPKTLHQIATGRVKWSPEYRKKYEIDIKVATNLPNTSLEKVVKLSKRIYKILGLGGYARLDLRLKKDGQIYFIEANPNPEVAKGEEFAFAAQEINISYPELLNKIIGLGIN